MANRSQMIAPAKGAAAVTPSDATDFSAGEANGIYVGSGGDVVVVFPDDTTATFVGVPTGTILPVRCVRVNSTNTSASSMLALYS